MCPISCNAISVCVCVCVCVCVSYQECVGAVSTDDPDANGLMLRFRTLSVHVDRAQVDDAFTGREKKHERLKRRAGGAYT